jgi:hypothetical protein
MSGGDEVLATWASRVRASEALIPRSRANASATGSAAAAGAVSTANATPKPQKTARTFLMAKGLLGCRVARIQIAGECRVNV